MSFIQKLMPTKNYKVQMEVIFNDEPITKFNVTVKAKYKLQAQKIAEKQLSLRAGKISIDK